MALFSYFKKINWKKFEKCQILYDKGENNNIRQFQRIFEVKYTTANIIRVQLDLFSPTK